MFNYGTPNYSTPTYTYSATPAAYSPRPAYQQPIYQQAPMMQDGAVQARLASCKEEAIASPVNPGVRTLFFDPTHGAVYSKLIDPHTGASDFHEYIEPAASTPEPPQYMTVEMFDQYRAEVERRLGELTVQPKRQQKGATTDD